MNRGRNIPAAMALARFLILEPQGNRAAANFLRLKAIVDRWVVKKDKNSYTINVYMTTPPDRKKKHNDFSVFDVSLPIVIAAKEMNKEYENDIDRFIDRFDMMCSMINEKIEDNKGFYWKFYVPYFAQMAEKELTDTFARMAFISTNDSSVIECPYT